MSNRVRRALLAALNPKYCDSWTSRDGKDLLLPRHVVWRKDYPLSHCLEEKGDWTEHTRARVTRDARERARERARTLRGRLARAPKGGGGAHGTAPPHALCMRATREAETLGRTNVPKCAAVKAGLRYKGHEGGPKSVPMRASHGANPSGLVGESTSIRQRGGAAIQHPQT